MKIIDDSEYEDFGFLLFRTDFSSDARWERFVVEWDLLLDKRLGEAGPETGLQRIAEKVFTRMVDDDCMGGMGADNVALYVLLPFPPQLILLQSRSISRGMTMAGSKYFTNTMHIVPLEWVSKETMRLSQAWT